MIAGEMKRSLKYVEASGFQHQRCAEHHHRGALFLGTQKFWLDQSLNLSSLKRMLQAQEAAALTQSRAAMTTLPLTSALLGHVSLLSSCPCGICRLT